MKSKRKLFVLLFALTIIVSFPMAAQAKVKLNNKRITIYEGQSVALELQGTTQRAKWSSNKTKIARVWENGKNKIAIIGRKKGKCTITARVGKKKYVCKVSVKKAEYDTITITKDNYKQYFAVYAFDHEGYERDDLGLDNPKIFTCCYLSLKPEYLQLLEADKLSSEAHFDDLLLEALRYSQYIGPRPKMLISTGTAMFMWLDEFDKSAVDMDYINRYCYNYFNNIKNVSGTLILRKE